MTRLAGLVLLVLTLASGCVSVTGRSLSQYVDDKAISGKVKMKLLGLGAGALTRVHVDTYEGIVYLSGLVEDDAMKARVGRLAGGVEDVRQIVNNLHVHAPNGQVAVSASPAPPLAVPSGLAAQLPGVAYFVADAGVGPQTSYRAYDGEGQAVATIYTVPTRELALTGLDEFRTKGEPIDHVSIQVLPSQPDVPEPYYAIVLWHVTGSEAAALSR